MRECILIFFLCNTCHVAAAAAAATWVTWIPTQMKDLREASLKRIWRNAIAVFRLRTHFATRAAHNSG